MNNNIVFEKKNLADVFDDMKFLAEAVSADGTRYPMQFIHAEEEGGAMVLVSTDGKRLHKITYEAGALAGVFTENGDYEIVSKKADTIILKKTDDHGTFPDWRKVVPKDTVRLYDALSFSKKSFDEDCYRVCQMEILVNSDYLRPLGSNNRSLVWSMDIDPRQMLRNLKDKYSVLVFTAGNRVALIMPIYANNVAASVELANQRLTDALSAVSAEVAAERALEEAAQKEVIRKAAAAFGLEPAPAVAPVAVAVAPAGKIMADKPFYFIAPAAKPAPKCLPAPVAPAVAPVVDLNALYMKAMDERLRLNNLSDMLRRDKVKAEACCNRDPADAVNKMLKEIISKEYRNINKLVKEAETKASEILRPKKPAPAVETAQTAYDKANRKRLEANEAYKADRTETNRIAKETAYKEFLKALKARDEAKAAPVAAVVPAPVAVEPVAVEPAPVAPAAPAAVKPAYVAPYPSAAPVLLTKRMAAFYAMAMRDNENAGRHYKENPAAINKIAKDAVFAEFENVVKSYRKMFKDGKYVDVFAAAPANDTYAYKIERRLSPDQKLRNAVKAAGKLVKEACKVEALVEAGKAAEQELREAERAAQEALNLADDLEQEIRGA
jgi:hypothetical protein